MRDLKDTCWTGLIALAILASPLARAVTLEEAFDAAEENNLDLRMAKERRIQAETYRGQAWALIQPKVVAQGTYTYNEKAIVFDPTSGLPDTLTESFDFGDPFVIQEQDYLAASVSVIQPIFAGTAFPLLKGAYHVVDAARADEVRTVSLLRRGVAQAFYGLGVAHELVRMTEEALVLAQSQAALAEKQVVAGLAPPRSRLQASLAVNQATREVASAKEQVVLAGEAFHRATGLPANSPIAFGERPTPPATLDDALSTAAAQRPDVKSADERIDAARAQALAKKAEWLPTLDGRFTYAWTQNLGFSDDPTLWMVVLEANWTLWDGGLRLAQTRQQVSLVRTAEAYSEQTRGVIAEDVKTAWERLARAEQALVAVEAEVALAKDNLSLAEKEFQAGAATWLEVETARLGRLGSELAFLRERTGRDLAAIDLQVAMGTY